MPRKVWDEITYPYRNFSGCTVDVWERISNFIGQTTMNVITYPCWDWSYSKLVKGATVVLPAYLISLFNVSSWMSMFSIHCFFQVIASVFANLIWFSFWYMQLLKKICLVLSGHLRSSVCLCTKTNCIYFHKKSKIIYWNSKSETTLSTSLEASGHTKHRHLGSILLTWIISKPSMDE